jgi:SAM-dependent methyltransferase
MTGRLAAADPDGATAVADRDEVARVRDVYRRRCDADRYNELRVDNVLAGAVRRAAWGSRLLAAGQPLGRVLEVGVGRGAVLRWAIEAGARGAVGVDVLPERLADARAAGTSLPCVLSTGTALPFAAASFDAVVCSTLFSSILDEQVRVRVAAEIARVLRPGGAVLWFDLARDNPRNPAVRRVGRPALRRLFPGFALDVGSAVLAPPLARALAPRWRLIAALEAVPPLRTHLAGLLWAPA